jgi:hypothetical protein
VKTANRNGNSMNAARQILWAAAIVGAFVAYGFAWRAIL